MISIINIGLLTYADEEFGGRDSFEDLLRVRYSNSMKEFLRERKKLALTQRLEVLLAGRIEVPGPLICQRELLMAEYGNQKVIPLVVKKGPQVGSAAQKFRLPFKNMGSSEIEIEFTFAKQTAVVSGPQALTLGKGSHSTSSNEDKAASGTPLTSNQITTSPLEFSVVPPTTMKVPPNGGSIILNIQAKLKNSYQLQNLKDAKAISQNPHLALLPKKIEKYNHLMICKIKDTQVVFSFFIEASVIESTGPANAMS
jgi:hypothetical protein